MLIKLGYPQDIIDRVSFLVGHHHTYSKIDGPDYQALVEADFLVNIFEGGMQRPEIEAVRKNIFRTATGKKLLNLLFLQ
ncbi:MAG: phosphohydrolase, partial [Acutalibacter sp.]|nr:phosphohydrolase [Acutalibacter sp.]